MKGISGIDLVKEIDNLFESKTNENYFAECGINHIPEREIRRISYCTNLTLDVIEKAHELNSDMIITHHDAWNFIFGLKDRCIEKLKEYDIGHYYNHLPLDDADFGTNASLLKKLGLNFIEKTCSSDGFYCGAVGEFNEPKRLWEVCRTLEEAMEEPVQWWKFNNRKIKRVHVLCGAGHGTNDMKAAVEKQCDVYITGEKILYTIEYAELERLNLIVGSHTFTEIFGVESLINLIKEKFPEIETFLIKEEHLEAKNLF